ncbi:asparagine synthase (glutamine-hydrolyzing) [Crenobacter cavernae]|uniref:asparagine synthase (glutamine-hydrolyzing) n=1 Tax=Crenobacter cavernae TaxID=2290923 RepID=A0ABY0FBN4_9NEIS|nr:asparagine synthase (glutamine-hydrolyzing) [Crenobacter cavernae]RXZ43462.1 asparagine synthase (glutamine-hydrolyzing) [Crenobacter cavernae]
MCGLTGFLQIGGFYAAEASALAGRMAEQIVTRGPDGAGVWVDDNAGIAFAHRRLAILDLSPAGQQPMASNSGRYIIVFNGEIYNHLALRDELERIGWPPVWRGHSDTETLLAGFEVWGIEATLRRTVGMFAIALWDREQRTLTLMRDRMGEKPVYYGWQGDAFLFGSELKALKLHPMFRGSIDRDAITLLLRHNTIPAPYSIYRDIRKLPPGTFATLRLADCGQQVEPTVVRYWSLAEAAERGQREGFSGSESDAILQLETKISEAVALQQIADVPLGAFLSGGIDSSAVVALMQTQSARPVKTFTIGFHEAGYNEAEHAKAVARHLGTDHTELYVSSDEALAVIPRLPTLYDEPFSDSSQIPTFLVSQLARQHVTVSLSGDGGDELFGGYSRYFLARSLWNKVKSLPAPGRQAVAAAIRSVPVGALNELGKVLSFALPARLRERPIGDRAHKLAEILAAKTPECIYRDLISHWKHPAELVHGATEPGTVLTDLGAMPPLPDFEHRMMYMDTLSYLPDDILVKVDRAAMGVSMETRVPFLDHRVVEFAWRLPLSLKIRNEQGKWLLRQVLYRHVPKELIERPKMGFGVPIDHWLRGPLRDWAESLLDESRLKREGFFDPQPIRRLWAEHLSGQRNWQYYLWDVLMFQAWLELQLSIE